MSAVHPPSPYDWQRKKPARLVGRQDLLDEVARLVRRGKSVALYGGHGMGKSAFLIELEEALSHVPGVVTIRLDCAPVTEDLTHALARALGISPGVGPREVLGSWRVSHPDQQLVLLYDELDAYVHHPVALAFFRALESAINELPVGLVGAGGLGLLVLKDRALGSAFLSRSPRKLLTPLTRDEVCEVSQAFEPPLTDEVLDTLWRFSGGSPALVTFGLETLWEYEEEERTVDALMAAVSVFIEECAGFLDLLVKSVSIKGRVRTVAAVLDLILRGDSPYSGQRLTDCVDTNDEIEVSPKQAIDVLRASGLVHVEGRSSVDPIDARPIHSILLNHFRQSRRNPSTDPRTRLVEDLTSICEEIHRLSMDFYKGKGQERSLVEEGTFSAVIAIGLRQRGWQEAEREAVQVSGRTDVKARLRYGGDHVLVEVKIWPRNDYKEVHEQVDGYRIGETRALAVVMIRDTAESFVEAYKAACLQGIEEVEDVTASADNRLRVLRAGSAPHLVTHFLLPVPGR